MPKKEISRKNDSKQINAKKAKPFNSDDFYSYVSKRAYELYRERIENSHHGDALSDWVTAEEEVRRKYNI
jgi:hypothetical protein